MKTKLLPILTFCMALLFSLETLAQETITLYYNQNWEVTTKANASYYRNATYDLSSFVLDGPVSDYTLDGKLLMTGNYDKGKKFGEFIFYYPGGQKQSTGNYKNGKRSGNWFYYFPNGEIKTYVVFLNTGNEDDFSVIKHHNASGKQTIIDGTGLWQLDSLTNSLFDKESLKTLTGHFKNGKKHGDWKLTRNVDGKILHSETFKNGEFIIGEVFNPQFNGYGKVRSETIVKFPDEHALKFTNTEDFKLDNTVYPNDLKSQDVVAMLKYITGTDYRINNRPASYPDGDYGLMQYLAANIRYPMMAIRKKEQGTVYVTVAVSAQGKTTAVSILKGVSKELDAEAIRVIKGIENWLPELKNGEPVSTIITVPVTFRVM